MTDTDDLKARLAATEEAETWYTGGYRPIVLVNPDGPEALARIEELEAQLATARADERERCAKRMEVLVWNTPSYCTIKDLREHIPAAIRAMTD